MNAIQNGAVYAGLESVETRANEYTDSEIEKLSVDALYQKKADSETSAAALDERISNIEQDYLKTADKTELQNEIDKKANLSALIEIAECLSIYAENMASAAVSSSNEYSDGISGEIRADLDELSGTVTAICSDYALGSDVSSKAELSEEFGKYYLKTATSSSTELSDEFKKYQLSGDYLSVYTFETTISTKADVSALNLSVETLSEMIDAKAISVTDETTSEGYLKSYTISQGGTKIGVIDIPKDFLVKSGEVKTCDEDDKPIEGYRVGDKYLDFIVNVAEGISAEDQHIYINVKDLTDVYSGTNGAEILVIVDSSNQISAVIQAGAISKEKIADAVYNDISCIASSYIENGINSLDIDEINGDASKTISKITENDGLVGAQFVRISIDMDQVSGLADKFDTYALSSDVSSKTELDEEFKKYQLSGNYLSVEVFENTISNYALSSDVSSKTELNGKFELIDQSLSRKLDRVYSGCVGTYSDSIAHGINTSAFGNYTIADAWGGACYTDHSYAFGDGGTTAGAMLFRILSSNYDNGPKLCVDVSSQILISGDYTGVLKKDWIINAILGTHINNASMSIPRKIVDVSAAGGNTVLTLDKPITDALNKRRSNSTGWAYLPDHPDIGDPVAAAPSARQGLGAFAVGDTCRALAHDSFAQGIKSQAVGKFSQAMGYNNKTGWLATAFGSCNKAWANGSMAIGGTQSTGADSKTNVQIEFNSTGAFAWSPTGAGVSATYLINNRPRTFNINPDGGANGFYIGHRTLPSIVREIVDGGGTGDSSARIIKIDKDGETFTDETTAEQFVNTYIDLEKPAYDEEETTIPKTPDEIKEEAEHLYAMTTEGDDKYNYYGIEVT